MRYTHYNEETFAETDVEFPDEMADLAEELNDSIANSVGLVMCSKDKKALILGVNLATNRVDRETGTHMYRIHIEKI